MILGLELELQSVDNMCLVQKSTRYLYVHSNSGYCTCSRWLEASVNWSTLLLMQRLYRPFASSFSRRGTAGVSRWEEMWSGELHKRIPNVLLFSFDPVLRKLILPWFLHFRSYHRSKWGGSRKPRLSLCLFVRADVLVNIIRWGWLGNIQNDLISSRSSLQLLILCVWNRLWFYSLSDSAAKWQRKQERPEQLSVRTDILFWRRSPSSLT